MPQKSRRKKQQLSHLKTARQAGAPAQPAASSPASETGTPAAAVAAPRLTTLKVPKQPAQLSWPLHVGAEMKKIGIIAAAILVVIVIVSVLVV